MKIKAYFSTVEKVGKVAELVPLVPEYIEWPGIVNLDNVVNFCEQNCCSTTFLNTEKMFQEHKNQGPYKSSFDMICQVLFYYQNTNNIIIFLIGFHV